LNSAGILAAAPDTLMPAGQDDPRIPSVDWWITSRCNLACDFCYGPVPRRDPVERREAILSALRSCSAPVVTFCGGEPLLVRKVDQYAAFLSAHGKYTVLNTNGSLLRKRLSQGFQLTFDVVGISVDGSTEEIHRAMRGPNADLGETLSAAKVISRDAGIRLKLATVVSSVNRDDLPSLARMVRDLQPDIWRLYQYSNRGAQNIGQRRHSLSADEFKELVDRIATLASPVPTVRSSETQTAGCLIVDPDGNVLQPSGTRYEHRGNCLTEALDDIWAKIPARSVILANKQWLSALTAPSAGHVLAESAAT
jgi:MoaA/NifB/PqqE/SkfB family radical SAM enzyme